MGSITVTSRPAATVGTKSHTTNPVTALPPEMRPSAPGGTIPRWVHAVPVQNRMNTILCCPDLLVRNEATVLPSAAVIGG